MLFGGSLLYSSPHWTRLCWCFISIFFISFQTWRFLLCYPFITHPSLLNNITIYPLVKNAMPYYQLYMLFIITSQMYYLMLSLTLQTLRQQIENYNLYLFSYWVSLNYFTIFSNCAYIELLSLSYFFSKKCVSVFSVTLVFLFKSFAKSSLRKLLSTKHHVYV